MPWRVVFTGAVVLLLAIVVGFIAVSIVHQYPWVSAFSVVADMGATLGGLKLILDATKTANELRKMELEVQKLQLEIAEKKQTADSRIVLANLEEIKTYSQKLTRRQTAFIYGGTTVLVFLILFGSRRVPFSNNFSARLGSGPSTSAKPSSPQTQTQTEASKATTAEVGKADAEKSEAERTEAARAEAARAEDAARAEAARAEAARAEDAARAEAARAEAARAEAARAEDAARAEAARAEDAARAEAARAEAARAEDAARAEAARAEDAARAEAARAEDAARAEAAAKAEAEKAERKERAETEIYTKDNLPTLPASVIAAKTVFIDNQTGYTQITDKAYEALSKWGRYKIVKDAKDADLVLRFTADNQDRPTQPGNNIDQSPTPIVLSVRDQTNNELWSVSKNKPFHSQTTLDIDEFKKRVEAQEKGK